MSSLKAQTIKGSKWNFLERISVQGMQFVLGIILARFLLPSDFGSVGVLAIFFAVSQAFIDGGFSSALIQKKNAAEKDYCTVFYFNIVASLIFYAILFVAAPYVALFFRIEILSDVLRVQSITLIVNAMMSVPVAILNINLDFKSLAKRNICATSLSGLCGILLAYLGYGIWALVFQQVVASVINFIFILIVCRWRPKLQFSVQSFKSLGAFGSRLLFSSLLHTLYTNMTSIAIGKFYSAKDLGYYSRGVQFAHAPNSAINGVLQTVSYPIFSKIQDDKNRLISAYRKYIRISSLVIFPISGLLCALAKPIIILFLTDRWIESVPYLHIFAFSCMFMHLNTINLSLLKVTGRSDLYLKLEIIKKSIAITLLFLAIPFGVIAICFSELVYTQIAVYLNTYYTGKLFHLGYIQQVKDILPYFCCVVLTCGPVYFFTFLDLPNVLIIFLGIVFAMAVYYLLLRKNEDMKEVVLIVKKQIMGDAVK